ncbi:MAG: RHS repeat-associated core domain-containing protein [Ignavibacteriae bacterium]|nr:RHS repeat-associated core domain-containing protein [Ignavibacteriota bacterium]
MVNTCVPGRTVTAVRTFCVGNPPEFQNPQITLVADNQIRFSVQNTSSPTNAYKWSLDNSEWSSVITLSANGDESLSNGILIDVGMLQKGTHTLHFKGAYEIGIGGLCYAWSYQMDVSFQFIFQNSVKTQSIFYPLQSSEENAETDISNLSQTKKSEAISYADGLGRASQTVSFKSSPLGNDVITHVEYDEYGLQTKSYLPFTKGNNDGGFRYYAQTEQGAFYNTPPTGVASTSSPFSQSVVERSPLLRVQEQGAPGADWRTGQATPHTIRTAYGTNTDNNVRKWEVDNNGNLIHGGYYAVGELYSTTTTDENSHEAIIFKDKSDQEILKRSFVGGGTPVNVETYYVYDDLGNLRFIIPPQALDQFPSSPDQPTIDNMRSKWVTKYNYDGYNRVVEKITPEGGTVSTIYDQAGRVVLTQDENMKSDKNWFFTRYDKLGRVVMTGIYHDESTTPDRISRQGMQNFIDGLGIFYAKRDESDIGYSLDDGFAVEEANIWTITYYDDYDFDSDGSDDVQFNSESEFSSQDQAGSGDYSEYWITGHTAFFRIKDKVTKTKTRILGIQQSVFTGESYSSCPTSPSTLYYKGNSIKLLPGFRTNPGQSVHIGANVTPPAGSEQYWIESAMFYDTYGRVIQTQTKNHLGGLDVASTQYDFSGKVLRTKLTHMKGNIPNPEVVVKQRFTYDNAGRLINTYQSNNGATEVLISKLEYNELSQLITKKLHSTNGGSTFLQSIDYKYNERGWLVSMNNPTDLSDANAISNDLFAFNLLYNDITISGLNNSPLYNGNISSMIWKSTGASQRQAYAYTYDELSRLTAANYATYASQWNAMPAYAEKDIEYDLNGNIKRMKRNKDNGDEIDNLWYHYDAAAPNKLTGVQDGAMNTAGYDFINNVWPYGAYHYDNNGNMIEDEDKGITIEYNDLNLPTTITWTDGRKLKLLYTATGSKLRMMTYDATGTMTEQREYVNGFEYKQGANPYLQQLPMSEGRVVNGGTGFQYEYSLKDHLGNVRVTFVPGVDAQGQPKAQLQDETFYYPFGLTEAQQISGEQNRYLYNGKELVNNHNLQWYDYGARWYDPQLGRWHVIDPLDEYHSPYVYVGNDPVNMIDPTGMGEEDPDEPAPNLPIYVMDPVDVVADRIIDGRYDINRATYWDFANDFLFDGFQGKEYFFEGGMLWSKYDMFTPSMLTGVPPDISTTGMKFSVKTARELLKGWHKGTFRSAASSLKYHLKKHGAGRGMEQYVKDAKDFFKQNYNKGQIVTLKDGTPGILIRTQGGGQGGYFTLDGKPVSFWYK